MDHDTAPEAALQAAASALGPGFGRYPFITPAEMSKHIIELAELLLPWLRRPAHITLQLVSIEEQELT